MKIKILLFLNIFQIIVLIFILDRVGYLKFNTEKTWENSFLYSSIYKDKTKLFEKYSNINKYDNPIIFLGDSITEKADWQELLSFKYIINRGIGSDTISGLINRLDSVIKLRPLKVFLMIGINDISWGGEVDEMFIKYKYLIGRLKKENIKIVILSTLATQISKYNQKVIKFNSLLKQVSLKEKLEYIDLNNKLSENGRLKDKYSFDGVHLTYEGCLVIKKVLNKKYKIREVGIK